MAYPRKLTISDRYRCFYARSNWADAIKALDTLCTDEGVLLDDFVENTFVFSVRERLRQGRLPYEQDWIGFIHCPPDMTAVPRRYRAAATKCLLGTRFLQKSLRHCRGIFCLSRCHRRWLELHIDVPVEEIRLPVATPSLCFDPASYLANPQKRIIHVGGYLRRLRSIFELRVEGFEKTLLYLNQDWFGEMFIEETRDLSQDAFRSTMILPAVDNYTYDLLLSKNVVFLHLYDCSACTTIVECLVRGTPVLVNRLEAVREYLGDGYPLYFDTLEEASALAADTDAVLNAHAYLARIATHARTTHTDFCRAVAESAIYSSL